VTYTRAQLDSAADQWARGDFSPEWDPWRRLAASGPGIIFPPDGDPYDSWNDEHPSQRAILIRAIRETPELLRWAITSTASASWSPVIAKVFEGRAELREFAAIDEARDRQRRASEPTPSQATYAIKDILTIIGDS